MYSQNQFANLQTGIIPIQSTIIYRTIIIQTPLNKYKLYPRLTMISNRSLIKVLRWKVMVYVWNSNCEVEKIKEKQ